MKLFENIKTLWEKLNIESLKDSLLEKVKLFFSNKKRNINLVILLGLFVINLILASVSRHIVTFMPETLGADRWSSDHRMAQVSLFFTEDQMVEEDGIKRLEYNLEKKLADAGVVVEEYLDVDTSAVVETVKVEDMGDGTTVTEHVPTISDLYVSSYCAQGIVDISFEGKTAESVNAIGFGGDFFFIHPLTLVSGSYINSNSLMKDGIVIDEELAWQLFGSNDIIGQQVTIGNVPHYICGVIKRDAGRIRKAAGLTNSYVYMSYDSLAKYGDILSGRTNSVDASEDGGTTLTGGINCYEIVMPDPVEGIASKIVKESTGVDDRYIYVVDNTNRFSFFSILKVMREFGTRSMWGKPIFYPYWENTARGWEDVLSVILFFRLVCIIIIAISITIWIVHLYRHKKWTTEGIIRYLLDKKYDFESRRRKNHEQEEIF
jgi:hypothetical protein